jgi:CRP-like cAMP-binding protein
LSSPSSIERVIRRLESVHVLDDGDRSALHQLPVQSAKLRARQDIVREGDRPSRCCILFEGIAGWYKTTGAGRRQILALQLSGDIPDLQSVHLAVLDSSLITITPCEVGFVQHEALRRLCAERPTMASAFWRVTLIDAAVFREWVANVGSRKALERVAHLLCELFTRLAAIGKMSEAMECLLPLTQGDIAEATGLSTVHVNRAVQELRRQRLISFERSVLTVLNWAGLQRAGDFDPTYLFLASRSKRDTPAGID